MCLCVCVSAVLIRYIILKLILNLLEMGSSFLQLIVADSLGRLFLVPFPFNCFFFGQKNLPHHLWPRHGCNNSHLCCSFFYSFSFWCKGSLKKGKIFLKQILLHIFGNFQFSCKFSISLLQDLFDLASLAPVLTHPGLILATLALYCCFYNIGFGPIKHTLLRWKYHSQLNVSPRQRAVLSIWAEDSWRAGNINLLVRNNVVAMWKQNNFVSHCCKGIGMK